MPLKSFPLLRLVDSVFGHLILFLLGYFYVPKRRMVFRPSTGDDIALTLARPGSVSQDKIYGGDLILCNHQSPLDIIYLCTL